MFKTRRLLTLVLLVGIAALAAGACGPGQQAEPTPTATGSTASPAVATPTSTPRLPTATPTPSGPTGELRIAMVNLGTENWLQRLAMDEQAILNLMGDTLLTNNRQNRLPIAGLVESWEMSADGLTWTFHLKKGIQFNEGWGELTAEDVRYTWTQYLRPDTVAPGAPGWQIAIDKNADNFIVDDPYTFRLRASKPSPDLLYNVSTTGYNMRIEPKKYRESVADAEAAKRFVGSGPFKFLEHRPGESITVEAVQKHWRKTPEWARVTILKVAEETTRIALLRSGNAELAPVSYRSKKELESAGVRFISESSTGSAFVVLGGLFPGWPGHTPSAPWWQGEVESEKGLKVREALLRAIDRQGIINKLLGGEGAIMMAPQAYIPGPFLYNNPEWKPRPYDLAGAKKLLAEGGYDKGFEVNFLIFNQGGQPAQQDISEAVAGMWEELGLTVKRSVSEYRPTVRTRLEKRTTAGNEAYIFITGFNDEPLRYYRSLANPKGSLSHFEHPRITSFLDKTSAELDLQKRQQMGRELGDWLVQWIPSLPLFATNALWGAAPQVGQWQRVPGTSGLGDIEYVAHAR